jgi:hypothetical protein
MPKRGWTAVGRYLPVLRVAVVGTELQCDGPSSAGLSTPRELGADNCSGTESRAAKPAAAAHDMNHEGDQDLEQGPRGGSREGWWSAYGAWLLEPV